MPGVTIGHNVIIGAGSVVTKSIPEGYMVAGNPIRHIGYTEQWYENLKQTSNLKSGRMGDEEKKRFLLSLQDDKFVHKPLIQSRESKK